MTKEQFPSALNSLQDVTNLITQHPYNTPLYILQSRHYLQLGYPDLASGAAYKASLLSASLQDEADEYHALASEALVEVVQQQPLEERIRMLKSEQRSEAEGVGNGGQGVPELDVEEDLWLRVHYLPLM